MKLALQGGPPTLQHLGGQELPVGAIVEGVLEGGHSGDCMRFLRSESSLKEFARLPSRTERGRRMGPALDGRGGFATIFGDDRGLGGFAIEIWTPAAPDEHGPDRTEAELVTAFQTRSTAARPPSRLGVPKVVPRPMEPN